MAIHIKKDDYISCFWIADDLDNNNFLMILRKSKGRWLLDCRFRYVKDEKVWDSADRKMFYQFKSNPGTSESEMLETCQEIFQITSKQYYMNSICQHVDGDGAKFLEAMDKYEQFHSKVEARTRGEQNEGP